jgi:hypothetical protein
LIIPGTSGGGYSVQQASSECSQAALSGQLPDPYTIGTTPFGDWGQGWSDGCVNQLVNGSLLAMAA